MDEVDVVGEEVFQAVAIDRVRVTTTNLHERDLAKLSCIFFDTIQKCFGCFRIAELIYVLHQISDDSKDCSSSSKPPSCLIC